MSSRRRSAFFAAFALLAACASPQSRIKAHRAAFDAYPPAIQRKISDGIADVGFTREQVQLALGTPDRRYARKTADAEQEVWGYGAARGASSLGFGLGFGMGGLGTTVGMGTEVGPGGPPEERVRVVFQDGAVVSVESRQR
jgi:hypothetical protein